MTHESFVLLVRRRFLCSPDPLICGGDECVFGYVKTCFRTYYIKTYDAQTRVCIGGMRRRLPESPHRRPCSLADAQVLSLPPMSPRRRPHGPRLTNRPQTRFILIFRNGIQSDTGSKTLAGPFTLFPSFPFLTSCFNTTLESGALK